jgi:hypothetical protein
MIFRISSVYSYERTLSTYEAPVSLLYIKAVVLGMEEHSLPRASWTTFSTSVY